MFGVPSFIVDGELFWGSEHLPRHPRYARSLTQRGECHACSDLSPRRLRRGQRRGPKPAAGQVLVKTLCCGICGTDLHAAKFTDQFIERSGRAGGRWPMDPSRDVVFGHEFCCEIVEHGAGTENRLKPGTLVCSMPMTIADATVQGIGYSNDIAGGFAQYMPLAERMLLPVRMDCRPTGPR